MPPYCVIRVSFWSVRRTLRGVLRRGAPNRGDRPGQRYRVLCASAVKADAKTVAAFTARINAYLDIHNKFESTLPKLPNDATPAQMDRHQRLFGPLVQKARAGAKRGDIFTPEMEAFLRARDAAGVLRAETASR